MLARFSASSLFGSRTALKNIVGEGGLSLASGDEIPIEQRAASEVTHVFGVPVAPDGTSVQNPAFDVTPARYVTAIITERGVALAPYGDSLKVLTAHAAGD